MSDAYDGISERCGDGGEGRGSEGWGAGVVTLVSPGGLIIRASSSQLNIIQKC